MRYPTPALWRCRVLTVHDGDTPTVEVDRGVDDRSTWQIRLKDVWAPELAEPGGVACRDFVLGWFYDNGDDSAWPFLVETYRTPRSDTEVKTLSRYVGSIRAANGRTLNADVAAFVTASGFGPGTT